MKSKLFASTALALVLSAGAALAAGPKAEITDAGNANTSYIEQKAGSSDSVARIEQAGGDNKASGSRIFSPYNYGAGIVQDGAGNTGHIQQAGTASTPTSTRSAPTTLRATNIASEPRPSRASEPTTRLT